MLKGIADRALKGDSQGNSLAQTQRTTRTEGSSLDASRQKSSLGSNPGNSPLSFLKSRSVCKYRVLEN